LTNCAVNDLDYVT